MLSVQFTVFVVDRSSWRLLGAYTSSEFWVKYVGVVDDLRVGVNSDRWLWTQLSFWKWIDWFLICKWEFYLCWNLRSALSFVGIVAAKLLFYWCLQKLHLQRKPRLLLRTWLILNRKYLTWLFCLDFLLFGSQNLFLSFRVRFMGDLTAEGWGY